MSQVFELAVPLFGVVAVLAGVLALRGARADRARRSRAVPTTGVVASVTADDNFAQIPVVRYRDADGAEHLAASAGTRPAQQLRSTRFQPGQQVRVVYDPERPTWVLVDGTHDPAGIGTVVGVSFVLIGVLLLAGDLAAHMLL